MPLLVAAVDGDDAVVALAAVAAAVAVVAVAPVVAADAVAVERPLAAIMLRHARYGRPPRRFGDADILVISHEFLPVMKNKNNSFEILSFWS